MSEQENDQASEEHQSRAEKKRKADSLYMESMIERDLDRGFEQACKKFDPEQAKQAYDRVNERRNTRLKERCQHRHP